MQVGDKIKIINYGHILHIPEGRMLEAFKNNPDLGLDEFGLHLIDTAPELVGQEGIISEKNTTQGITTFAIDGPSKHAWYDERQIEVITN